VAENDRRKQRRTPPEFMSTHPAEASRVQKIQSLLPTVIPLYEAAHKQGS